MKANIVKQSERLRSLFILCHVQCMNISIHSCAEHSKSWAKNYLIIISIGANAYCTQAAVRLWFEFKEINDWINSYRCMSLFVCSFLLHFLIWIMLTSFEFIFYLLCASIISIYIFFSSECCLYLCFSVFLLFLVNSPQLYTSARRQPTQWADDIAYSIRLIIVKQSKYEWFKSDGYAGRSKWKKWLFLSAISCFWLIFLNFRWTFRS